MLRDLLQEFLAEHCQKEAPSEKPTTTVKYKQQLMKRYPIKIILL
jgi:hypothetical protein